jgi:hypothetical protein
MVETTVSTYSSPSPISQWPPVGMTLMTMWIATGNYLHHTYHRILFFDDGHSRSYILMIFLFFFFTLWFNAAIYSYIHYMYLRYSTQAPTAQTRAQYSPATYNSLSPPLQSQISPWHTPFSLLSHPVFFLVVSVVAPHVFTLKVCWIPHSNISASVPLALVLRASSRLYSASSFGSVHNLLVLHRDIWPSPAFPEDIIGLSKDHSDVQENATSLLALTRFVIPDNTALRFPSR